MPKTPPYSKEFKREAVQLLRVRARVVHQRLVTMGYIRARRVQRSMVRSAACAPSTAGAPAALLEPGLWVQPIEAG